MSFAKLESFTFDKVTKTRLPSVTIAVVRGNEVIWSNGTGYRDLAAGLPATPHSLYSIGSVTKSFTAVAIMQLAEQGKLNVNDPIDKYLPFDIRPMGEPVRIWHFLSHSSGIPGLAYAECVIGGMVRDDSGWLPISSSTDMLTFMKDAGGWVLAKPGERWFYLNEGYVLLSAIIEKVSGKSYADYMRECVFEPLGMSRTYIRKQDVEKDLEVAVPYLVDQKGDRIASVYPYGLTGDGGIISNVQDLAKYVSMYLGFGKGSEEQILQKVSVEEMETPRVTTANRNGPFGDYRYAYGLGVMDNFLGHKLVGHSGSVGVSTAYMGFLPEKQLGVAVLANGSGYAPSQIGQYALAEALGEDPDSLPFVRRENALSELEGVYETYKGTMRWEVKAMGDFLGAISKSRHNTSTLPLIPEKLDGNRRLFYTLSGGIKMNAEFRIEDGEVGLIYERYYLKRVGKSS